MKLSTFFSFSLLLSGAVLANKPVLTVYTYDSFASQYGPAHEIATLFEQECHCNIKFISFEDGVTMFNRLRLEGKKTKADVMLGIDHFVLPEAEQSGLFAEHELQNVTPNLPLVWENKTFLPYDFGEYAFIYNKQKLANPPTSLRELVERQDLNIIYQDPRTSTVGRGLLFWLNRVYGEQTVQAWQDLAKHTVTIGKGWSETYGAFLKGESDLVLSYTTSPLYHQWYENSEDYVAASFEEGHLVQVEVAGLLKNSKNQPLARQFLHFLQQPNVQKIIARRNVMKPVNAELADEELRQMPHYTILPFTEPDNEKVKQWLNQWQQAVSQ